MRRAGTGVIGVLTLFGGLAIQGCGSDGGSTRGDAQATEADFEDLAADAQDLTGRPAVEVDVPDNRYEPVAATVDPGTAVTWQNVGRNDHNVTPAVEGSFEGAATADFAPGASHEVTFDEAGTYGYFCSVHGTAGQGQRGVIVVG